MAVSLASLVYSGYVSCLPCKTVGVESHSGWCSFCGVCCNLIFKVVFYIYIFENTWGGIQRTFTPNDFTEVKFTGERRRRRMSLCPNCGYGVPCYCCYWAYGPFVVPCEGGVTIASIFPTCYRWSWMLSVPSTLVKKIGPCLLKSLTMSEPTTRCVKASWMISQSYRTLLSTVAVFFLAPAHLRSFKHPSGTLTLWCFAVASHPSTRSSALLRRDEKKSW